MAGRVALASLLVAAIMLSTASAIGSEPGEHSVEIVNFEFVPAMLAIKPGDTVTWINRDIVPHTATSPDGSMDTGEIPAGESRSVVILSDSLVRYICTYHPAMQGEIVP